jgi:hypothetical protein
VFKFPKDQSTTEETMYLQTNRPITKYDHEIFVVINFFLKRFEIFILLIAVVN